MSTTLFRPDASDLECDAEVPSAMRVIEAFEPREPAQARAREFMLDFCERHPADAHRRTCQEGHLTGSALLLDHDRERVLLTHHKKLDRWLQRGGHCDGDANLLATAWREAVEESGFEPALISTRPVDLDVHEIPARPGVGEPAHWHLDVRYLLVAAPGARPVVSSESNDVRWFALAEALELDLDVSLVRLLRIANS